MSDRRSIFRDAALERLSTPEQLDQLIEVTSPKSWIALGAVFALLAGLLAWGVFGTVTTRVDAQGILLGGDLYDVVPLAGGQVLRVAVDVDQRVEAGALIAEVDQPALRRQRDDARARLEELRAAHARLAAFGSQDIQLQKGMLGDQRRLLEEGVRNGRERLAQLDEQLRVERELQAQGLITRGQVRATEQLIARTREEVERAASGLKESSARELSAAFDQQQQLAATAQRVGEAERVLAQLEQEYTDRSQVRTAQAGRVVALLIGVGELVTPGAALAKLDLAHAGAQRLQAVVYVPTADGKRIEPGMEIRIAPASVKPEEHGYVLGTVTRVASFPATTASMMHVFKNDQLVQQLSSGGAPFEVLAALSADPRSASGYRWTSGAGPATVLGSGTPCSARIAVETRRPIELVIPMLRKALKMY